MNISFTEYHSATYSWRKWNNGFKEYWETINIPSLTISNPEGYLFWCGYNKNLSTSIFSTVYSLHCSVSKGDNGAYFTPRDKYTYKVDGWFFTDVATTLLGLTLEVYMTGI